MGELFIHDTSRGIGCTGESGAKIYRHCDVQGSHIGRDSTVGDFSRLKGCRLAERVIVQRNAMMHHVDMGRFSYTGKNFTAWHCSIGSFCSISWNVSIGGANHDYSLVTTHSFLYSSDFGLLPEGMEDGCERFEKPCIIENDVWIAANACICRGVTVHTGAVIGAGAVVTHDVAPYTIVTGVPAKPLKKRFDDETIAILLESRWWELPEEWIKANFSLFHRRADPETAKQLLRLRERLDREITTPNVI